MASVTNAGGEPLDLSVDLVPIALRGLMLAVLVGTTAMALVLLGVRILVRSAPGEGVGNGTAGALLLAGTLAAVLLAVAVAWQRLAPIGSTFRRGGLAMVAGFGTLVAGFAAAPVHYYLGEAGLAGVALAAAGGAAGLALRRRRPAG